MIVTSIKNKVWRNSDLKFSALELRLFKERNSNNKHNAPNATITIALKVGEGIMLGTRIILINTIMISHL